LLNSARGGEFCFLAYGYTPLAPARMRLRLRGVLDAGTVRPLRPKVSSWGNPGRKTTRGGCDLRGCTPGALSSRRKGPVGTWIQRTSWEFLESKVRSVATD